MTRTALLAILAASATSAEASGFEMCSYSSYQYGAVCMSKKLAQGYSCSQAKNKCRRGGLAKYAGLEKGWQLSPTTTGEFVPDEDWLVREDSYAAQFTILRQDRRGGLELAIDLSRSLEGRWWGSMLLEDFDGDGVLDLAVGDPDNSDRFELGGAVHIWFGPLLEAGDEPHVTLMGTDSQLGYGEQLSVVPQGRSSALAIGTYGESFFDIF